MSLLNVIPGFTALSDQVFTRNVNEYDNLRPSHHLHTIIIYGWSNGTARNVAKFTDGYTAIFPHSRQIAVLTPIAKAMFANSHQRTAAMFPVIDTLGALDGPDDASILVQAMSNTGGVNYSATLYAFRERYGRLMPHQLLVFDSTPGSFTLSWPTLQRWSRAMSIGTANSLPWPATVTQCLCGSFLLINVFAGWLLGREAAGAFAMRIIDDASYQMKEVRRLYLYSQEDDLVAYEDIEHYAAESRQKGYRLRAEVFKGSGHVGHMRMYPEKYWKAVIGAWTWTGEGSEIS
jgi:hypothetical protein